MDPVDTIPLRSRSRKKPRPIVVKEPIVTVHTSRYSDQSIKEGEECIEYLLHYFTEMFDGAIIKHFDIRYATSNCMLYSDAVNTMYHDEIQPTLCDWLHQEQREGRLFERTNWKLMHDSHTFVDTHMQYNTLFRYNNYYFQLILEHSCDDCTYCLTGAPRIHFELALFGWTVDGSDLLQPDHIYTVDANHMMVKQ